MPRKRKKKSNKKKKLKEGRRKEPASQARKRRGVVQLMTATIFHPSIFSPNWGCTILVARGENTWVPQIFHSPLPNQTPIKSVFSQFFSPLFSIFPISLPTKRTLRVCIYMVSI